jgi:hypothetical protein
MVDETLHPVVQLLLKRMESHPEEFQYSTGGRWQYALDMIEDHGAEGEKAALQSAIKIIRLEEAHVWALNELCNGDERRGKAKLVEGYQQSLAWCLNK